jgi:hypothetical protein
VPEPAVIVSLVGLLVAFVLLMKNLLMQGADLMRMFRCIMEFGFPPMVVVLRTRIAF